MFPLLLPKMERQIERAYMMTNGDKVNVMPIERGTLLILPTSAEDPADNVVVLETQ